MYTTLQSREQTTRRALDAGKPERVVRRDVQRIVVGYEGLVARFPRTGYARQRAVAGGVSRGRQLRPLPRRASTASTRVRLLRRLANEYPASPLIKRAEPALKRCWQRRQGRATPARRGRRAPVPAPRAAGPASAPSAAEPRRCRRRRRRSGARARPATRTELAHIQAIRRTVLPDVVRIAIELDQETEYRYERIEGPVRVFLDLAATEVGAAVAATHAV